MMEYMIIIFLLLSIHVGETTQAQLGYQQSYVRMGIISDAYLVACDPRFPQSYADRTDTRCVNAAPAQSLGADKLPAAVVSTPALSAPSASARDSPPCATDAYNNSSGFNGPRRNTRFGACY
jgi:hypothetical protein